jgi:uracil-DNA glycosylase
MSESSQPTPEDLARQAQQHLASLKAAGVDWLPVAPPRRKRSAAAAAAPAPSLFGDPEPEASAAPVSPVAAPALAPEQRRRELEVLAEKVSTCRRCAELVATRTQTVFGVGPLDAELCFIGEGPGADEDAQGEPFVGAAGQLLNRIIAACGMKREEVYICNIVKCRPPGNRTPRTDEAAHCREYLERQLELIQPKFICALGSTAAANLLGTTLSIGKLRGRFHDYRGIPVLCTYHPAFLLPHRSPEKKKDVWEDMKKLMERMGRTIPGRK